MRPVGPHIHEVPREGEPLKRSEKTLFELPERLPHARHATNTLAIEWLIQEIAPKLDPLSHDKKVQEALLSIYFYMVTGALKFGIE